MASSPHSIFKPYEKITEWKIEYKSVNPNENLNSFEFVLKKQTELFSINKDENKKKCGASC